MRGLTFTGNVLVGKFAGISDGDYPRLLVTTVRADNGELYEHRLDYSAFNPQSGMANELGKNVMDIAIGSTVAVAVAVGVSRAPSKKTGLFFPTFRAVRIEQLSESDSVYSAS
jgi:hypothetical protein